MGGRSGGVVRCETERATLLIGFSIEKRPYYHRSKLGTTACRRTETVFFPDEPGPRAVLDDAEKAAVRTAATKVGEALILDESRFIDLERSEMITTGASQTIPLTSASL